MAMNQGILKQYDLKETINLLKGKEKLVYIDNGTEEFVARYKDLPHIIVDVNQKLGHTQNLKVYDFKNPEWDNPLLTTIGYFLDKCRANVRKDIFSELVDLQLGELEVRDYKIIDEDTLEDARNIMELDEMER